MKHVQTNQQMNLITNETEFLFAHVGLYVSVQREHEDKATKLSTAFKI